MKEWEEILEPQLQQIISFIEKIYYQHDISEAL